MIKQITREAFEALKADAARVEEERDIEYSYETLFDADGNETAFASYHSYHGAEYKRHDKPRAPAVYDEDGDQIERSL